MACTEQGEDTFNVVQFLCIYITSTVLNTKLLHDVYLFLPHLSASVFDHLHGAHCSFDVCRLNFNIFGKFTDMIKIIIIILDS